jgi:hypothetical protein
MTETHLNFDTVAAELRELGYSLRRQSGGSYRVAPLYGTPDEREAKSFCTCSLDTALMAAREMAEKTREGEHDFNKRLDKQGVDALVSSHPRVVALEAFVERVADLSVSELLDDTIEQIIADARELRFTQRKAPTTRELLDAIAAELDETANTGGRPTLNFARILIFAARGETWEGIDGARNNIESSDKAFEAAAMQHLLSRLSNAANAALQTQEEIAVIQWFKKHGVKLSD